MLKDTKYLSKISDDKLLEVWDDYWSKGLAWMQFGVGVWAIGMVTTSMNVKSGSLAQAIGSVVFVLIGAVTIMAVGFSKIKKAKAKIAELASEHNLPEKETVKEYRKNLQNIRKMIKKRG